MVTGSIPASTLKRLANRQAWNLAQLRRIADNLELLEQARAANALLLNEGKELQHQSAGVTRARHARAMREARTPDIDVEAL